MQNVTKYDIMSWAVGTAQYITYITKQGERVMKKRMLAILLAAMMILSLAGCGKFTCDLCGQEKSGKKHTETLFGQKITYCNDCYKELEELGDALGF